MDLDEDEDMDQGSKSDDVNDEEEEEGDDDEFIDLLDVLDGKGEIDIGSDTEDTPKPHSQPAKQRRTLARMRTIGTGILTERTTRKETQNPTLLLRTRKWRLNFPGTKTMSLQKL